MYNNYKYTYANINKSAFQIEADKKAGYYANVVMWTTLFSLPLFFLIDYILLKDNWVDLVLVRLIGFGLSYIIYTLYAKGKLNTLQALVWFIGVNVAVHSLVCALVPSNNALGYFLILGMIILAINTTIYWPSIYSIYTCLLSYAIIFIIYSMKNRVDKYNIMVDNGGGIYFLISAFSCFLAYTRFNIIGRDIEKMVMLTETHNKLLDKNERLKEQEIKVADNERKFKAFDELQQQTASTINQEISSYSQTVDTTVDKIAAMGGLSAAQLDSLNELKASKQKLDEIPTQVSAVSSKVETPNYNREYFNLNPEVERAAIDLIDSIHLKNMSLQLNISPAANNVYQEKTVVEQMLNKLLNNVIRNSEAGSTVTLRAERVSDKAIIESTSHSPYVTDEKLTELMQSLKDNALTDNSNVDEVGMTSTKNLVESMGGTFYYKKEENKGNYFKIELPSTQ